MLKGKYYNFIFTLYKNIKIFSLGKKRAIAKTVILRANSAC